MDVLVIGGGGREHAICYALNKSKHVNKIYCLPGNAGISEIAECVNIGVMDFPEILEFLDTHPNIAMTVVAPDDPLAMGLVDLLQANNHRAFGPSKDAALIEASKAFSKRLMKKYNLPTAKFEEFTDIDAAYDYVEKGSFPTVIKADGLALGKGVIIAQNLEEAKTALKEMMLENKFKDAGKKVVIEEFLTGREVSILCFTDGTTIVPMVSSQDHKRAYDNDEGLNTGGMGTFSPSKIYTEDIAKSVYDEIILPTMNAMNAENRKFKGVLYFGLMITNEGVKIIEYNSRFGDPETQVVLPRLKTDLYEIFDAIIDERLADVDIQWEDNAAVCVILASGGYPEAYDKGVEIAIGDLDKDIILFHSGTALKDGKLVTNGGRVIGVTACGKDIEDARSKAYSNIEKIHFDKMHYRKDIGIKL